MATEEIIEVSVKGKTRDYQSSVSKAGKATKVFAKGVGTMVTGVAAATAAMVLLTQKVADLRNELTDAEIRTGISARSLSGLRLAAEGSGLAFSELEGSLNVFPKRLADFARGTGEAKFAFEALGISVTDSTGQLRSADAVMAEVLDKINAIPDPTTKAALATQIFAESGGKLLQALSGAELGDFIAFAEEFGVGVGPDAAAAADDWQRSTANLNTVLEGQMAQMVDMLGITQALTPATVILVGAFTLMNGAVNNLTVTGSLLVLQLFKLDVAFARLTGNSDVLASRMEFLEQKQAELVAQLEDPREAAREAMDRFRELAAAMKETSVAAAGSKGGLDTQTGALKEMTKAQNELFDIIDSQIMATLSAEDQLRAAMGKRIAKIEELGKVSGDAFATDLAIAGERKRLEEELSELRDKLFVEEVERGLKLAEFKKEQAEKTREEQEAAFRATFQTAARTTGIVADVTRTATSDLLGFLEESISFNAQLGEKGKAQARKQFAVMKAIMLGQAIATTAAAVTGALASFPFPPLSIPQSVAAGVAGGVQIGKIAALQPAFHIGSRGDLAPDEGLSRVTRREVVLTPQGQSSSGLSAADANAGLTGRGQVTQLVIGHDAFDVLLRDATRPGSEFERVIRGGSRVGHRPRRNT